MDGKLGITETTESRLSTLVASIVHEQKEITLKAGAGSLTRGMVLSLNTVTKKWERCLNSGSNGVATARAILLEDCDATDREMKCEAYFIGSYLYVDMLFPADATRHQEDTQILNLQDRGILTVGRDFSTGLTTTTTTTSTTTSSSTTTSTTTTTTAP